MLPTETPADVLDLETEAGGGIAHGAIEERLLEGTLVHLGQA